MSNRIQGYTPVKYTDFTVINLGDRTISSTTGWSQYGRAVYMYGPAKSLAWDLCCLVKTAPTPPYTVDVHLANYGSWLNAQCYGACWRNSSDGYIATFQVLTSTAPYDVYLRNSVFSSPTAVLANYVSTQYVTANPQWYRLEDDGVNRKTYTSTDGVNWKLFYSVGRTDRMTPNQIGFFIAPYSQISCIEVDHFKINYSG